MARVLSMMSTWEWERHMPDDEGPPRDADEGEAKLKIASGLKACRAMVADYRTKLGGSAADELIEQHAANDDTPAGENGGDAGPK
jgi:hypothetical protein